MASFALLYLGFNAVGWTHKSYWIHLGFFMYVWTVCNPSVNPEAAKSVLSLIALAWDLSDIESLKFEKSYKSSCMLIPKLSRFLRFYSCCHGNKTNHFFRTISFRDQISTAYFIKEKKEQGRIHGIRCVLARNASNFGRKRHFCRISTRVWPTDGPTDGRTDGHTLL